MSKSPDPALNFSRGKNQQKPKQGPSSEVSEIIDLEIFCIIQVTQKAIHCLLSATWNFFNHGDDNKAQRTQGSKAELTSVVPKTKSIYIPGLRFFMNYSPSVVRRACY